MKSSVCTTNGIFGMYIYQKWNIRVVKATVRSFVPKFVRSLFVVRCSLSGVRCPLSFIVVVVRSVVRCRL